MAIIEISGISVYAYHGCYEEEQRIGQFYAVNIVIQANIEDACKNDELSNTIDYTIIHNIVKAEMAVRSRLIEHVAFRIKEKIQLRFPRTEGVQVSVLKNNPPVAGSIKAVKITV